MRLRRLFSCLLLFKIVLLTGCTMHLQNILSNFDDERDARPLKIGVLLSEEKTIGLISKDAVGKTLAAAAREHDIEYDTVAFIDDEEARKETLHQLRNGRYDLIVGLGQENAPAIRSLSIGQMDTDLAVIDATVEAENVASIVYREEEADFLMGALAAMLSKSHKVGFIGGAELSAVHHVKESFIHGVRYQNSRTEVLVEFTDTFTDMRKGENLATDLYLNEDVDVIYHAAGESGNGVIKAALMHDGMAMGAGRDEVQLAPLHIAGNRLKQVDTVLLELIDDLAEDSFQPGIRSLGLKENGLSTGPPNERIVTQEMLEQLEWLEAKIIAGEIEVKP